MIRNKKLISDNLSVSSMSVHGGSTTTIFPDGDRIPRKNLKNKLSEISITGNEITQELHNQRKKAKVDSIIDVKTINLKLTPPPYKHKHEYVGGTNEKTVLLMFVK